MVRKLNSYYLLLAVLAAVYLAITMLLPPDPRTLDRLSLNPLTLKLLNLTVVLPFIAIWVIAFYGFVHLKRYTMKIVNSEDGKALHTIANGLMILAISLPTSGIMSGLLNFAATQPDPMAVPLLTIIKNYVTLALYVAAFLLISKGSKMLVAHLKQKPADSLDVFGVPIIVILGAVYTYLALTNPNRVEPSEVTGRALYYLSDPAIFLTIIIPYLFVWFYGLRSSFYLNYFREKVSGVIYKDFLKFLAFGISFVVISSIAAQFLTAVSASVVSLTLLPLLMLVYVLVAVMAVGYIFIAMGAKRLNKIEEV